MSRAKNYKKNYNTIHTYRIFIFCWSKFFEFLTVQFYFDKKLRYSRLPSRWLFWQISVVVIVCDSHLKSDKGTDHWVKVLPRKLHSNDFLFSRLFCIVFGFFSNSLSLCLNQKYIQWNVSFAIFMDLIIPGNPFCHLLKLQKKDIDTLSSDRKSHNNFLQ